jgi:triosephosphate isomerase (TIM)
VGHSERRQLFAETDVLVLKKFQQALAAELIPVLCVGEDLHAHETKQSLVIIEQQLTSVFADMHKTETKWIIAYEPIWAIGTGKVATPEYVQHVHAWIRQWLSHRLSKEHAAEIPLIYGGSVKPENAKNLLTMPDINGLLVGGASLDPKAFQAIVQSGQKPI